MKAKKLTNKKLPWVTNSKTFQGGIRYINTNILSATWQSRCSMKGTGLVETQEKKIVMQSLYLNFQEEC